MQGGAVDQIKERLTIEEVVSSYVDLKQAGKNLRGLSPFSPEKTPSFYVSPDRGVYYCFSTSKGGDMFTFIQEMEGVDFKESLRMLATRAGVELVPEKKEDRDQRERSLRLLDEVCAWYQHELLTHPSAQSYLEGRGVVPATMHVWRLGFVPDQWRLVHDHFIEAGYSEAELQTVGLIKQGPKGGWYDRFRGRIMFPLFDTEGRPVAFSGRAFEYDAEKEPPAKYLNSPETSFYDKSRLLYGYHEAKSAIRKYNFSIVVEGQMDLVMSHQAGFKNTVAVSGTGLTRPHLELLGRGSQNVVMAFDGDAAGLRSTARGAELALRVGMEVKIAVLPDGKDPADIIQENPEIWRTAIREAQHVVSFYLAILKQTAKDDRQYTRRVRTEVLPLVAAVPSPVDQARLADTVAEALRIPANAVLDEVRLITEDVQTQAPRAIQQAVGGEPAQAEVVTRLDTVLRAFVGLLWYLETRESDEHRHLVAETEKILDPEMLAEKQTLLENRRDELTFKTELLDAEADAFRDYVTTVVAETKAVALREELRATTWELAQAEQIGDDDRVALLLGKTQALAQQIHQ